MVETLTDIHVDVGGKETALTRGQARDLFFALSEMYEDGALDEPIPEIHTVPTQAEYMMNQALAVTAERFGAEIHGFFTRPSPFSNVFLENMGSTFRVAMNQETNL